MKNGEQPINSVTITDQVPSITHLGLTKREYFAAMAMQGMVIKGYYSGTAVIQQGVKEAVIIADALLAELDKTKSE